MKTKLLMIALLAMLGFSKSFATHIAGGELTYKWLHGTVYKFSYTFYRDCAGVTAPGSITLNYSSASCNIINKNATMSQVPGTGTEITLYGCAGQTTCTGGSNPGFQKWEYTDTLDIKKRCTDWVFSAGSCCRNSAITTIQNPGGDNLYIESTLNNLDDTTASSPVFLNPPKIILCIGQQVIVNNGAWDPDGDSLVSSFIAPRIDATTPVTYNAPYSATNWIASVPPASIDAFSGDITITPTTIQVGVTVVLVKKYHLGALVGSVLRDVEFVVVNCAADNLPTASGANGTSSYDTTVCPGTPLSFSVLSDDQDVGDTVTMTWNNGIPGASFNVSGAPHATGTFSWTPSQADARDQPYRFVVTAIDNKCPYNGYQAFSYTIRVPLLKPVISSPSFQSCFSDTASVTATCSGGASPYIYSWSDGQSGAVATGLTAGTYSVTITDSLGCTITAPVTITVPGLLTTTLTAFQNAFGYNISCYGVKDGLINLSPAGGTEPYTYQWSSGNATTQNLSGVGAGTHKVTVADHNGCSVSDSITLTQPDTIHVISSVTNVSCQYACDGNIHLDVTGGIPPYRYVWFTGATTQNINDACAGYYCVEITDTSGCTYEVCDTIRPAHDPLAILLGSSGHGQVYISCYGDSDASIGSLVTGGVLPYRYDWSGGDTTEYIDNLGAGTYVLTVTDLVGCSSVDSVTLVQPDPVKVTYHISNYNGWGVKCADGADGFICLSVSGGIPGYDFTWTPNISTDSCISDVATGSYCISVTDAHGCLTDTCIMITSPLPLGDSSMSHDPTCSSCTDGDITINAFGGTPLYNYSWIPDVFNDSTANGLGAGTYIICTTDANGCNVCDTVVLNYILYQGDADPKSAVVISPNPAVDELKIKFNKPEMGNIEIYNLVGEKVVTPESSIVNRQSSIVVDVSTLSPGIYFVQVISESGRWVGRFVKE